MEKLRIQSTVVRGTGLLLFRRARNGYATGHGSFCSPRLKEEGPGEKEGSATQRVARLERLLHHDCAILGLQKFPDIIAHPSRHFPASIHTHSNAPEAAQLGGKQILLVALCAGAGGLMLTSVE